MAEASSTSKDQEKAQGKQFIIQKIYMKDASFETPNSPDVFRGEWKPKVNLEIANKSNHIEGAFFEAVLTVTLTAKLEEKTAYLIEINQAGIFHINGFPEEEMNQITTAICPNILFPYAREAISDLVTRGGFPQLLLAPVNFDSLYAQHKKNIEQKQKEKEKREPSSDTKH